MTSYDVVRAAIPGADDSLCEHVVWGRTTYPCASDLEAAQKEGP